MLNCRRYMAEILPICRKTLSNQSINQYIELNVIFIGNVSQMFLQNIYKKQ